MIIKLAQEQLLSQKEKRKLLGSALYAGGMGLGFHGISKDKFALLPVGFGAMMAGGNLLFSNKKKS
jgi:hypothetical protein